jgi:hypothetical protein
MAFDNHYPNRKDKRKPYYRAGKCDKSCRPNGGCPWCRGNRMHSTKKREVGAYTDETFEALQRLPKTFDDLPCKEDDGL